MPGSESGIAEILSIMKSLNGDFQSQARLLTDLDSKVDTILAAFPDGGLMQHRIFHEKQLVSDQDSHEFKKGIVTGIARLGLWSTVCLVSLAVWQYVKTQIHL